MNIVWNKKRNGVLARQDIIGLMGDIIPGITKEQVQPSSIDLPIGGTVTAVRSAFHPHPDETIEETIKRYRVYDFELDDTPKILMKDHIYMFPIDAELSFPQAYHAFFNPKSTTGRGDLNTKVLVDGAKAFDAVSEPKGKAYIMAIPMSFNTTIKKGMSTNQMRIYRDFPKKMTQRELFGTSMNTPLLYNERLNVIPLDSSRTHQDCIRLSLDLENDIVAYRARKSSQNTYPLSSGRGEEVERKEDFWETIKAPRSGELVLEPGEFYLLATRERVSFPSDICGMLEPIDVNAFEGRSHYAGFFDSGFGFSRHNDIKGTPVTLEVRVNDVPMVVRHGQFIAKMNYEKMTDTPKDDEGKISLYGEDKYKSNYQLQPRGPTLPKQFLRG